MLHTSSENRLLCFSRPAVRNLCVARSGCPSTRAVPNPDSRCLANSRHPATSRPNRSTRTTGALSSG